MRDFRRLLSAFILLAAVPASWAQSSQPSSAPASQPSPRPLVAFEIGQGERTRGRIVFELEPRKSPLTVANFLRYVDDGYFDGTIIHRVVVGENARIQVFQGGGYSSLNQPNKPGQHEPIKLESQNGLRNARGTIAMARDADPDTATSEFFVNIDDNYKLDYVGPEKPGYCAFGRIIEGFDVVERIAGIETRTNPDPELKGEKSQPLDPPVVRTARRVSHDSETWWFPGFIPTGGRQAFHVAVNDVVTYEGEVANERDEADFEVEILPRPGGLPGVVARLAEPRAPLDEKEETRRSRSLAWQWISRWATANPDGVTVTADELLVREAPLLRGPWRTGERSRMLGFAAMLLIPVAYGQVLGFLEYQVRDIQVDRVSLDLSFWLGARGPDVRGTGELTFVKDDHGMTEVQARWKRSTSLYTREVVLHVTRRGVESRLP